MTSNYKLTHEKAPGIEVYFLEVTPEAAAEFLKKNTQGQRSISSDTVEKYASDMVTLDWIVNGDAIRFASNGELIDGQHRLSSIVMSGESQVLLVVTGLDKEAMTTIDSGRKRTYADLLKMRGVTNPTLVAALAGRAWHWMAGNYSVRNVARIHNAQHTNAIPSNAQKDAAYKAIEAACGITLEAAAAFGHKASIKRPGISSSTYAFVWMLLSRINVDLREEFFHEILIESKSPKLGYPIQAFHNRLMNLKGDDRLSNVDQLHMLIHTYNRWVTNQELTYLRPPRPVRWNNLATPDGYEEIGK